MIKSSSNMASKKSIFKKYYSHETFTDNFLENKDSSIDVIIPVLHSNELWGKNLISMYREIPIRRLLIGDGGCKDNTIEIVKKYPRVTVFDHSKYTSLGFSIKKLIEKVESDWFIYLHSDVYLPKGWFTEMQKNQNRFDWFECNQRITALVEYPLNYDSIDRPFSGSQMGKKEIFSSVIKKIDDDFLYRNEDIVFAELLQKQGFRYGRVDSTFHYHQLMLKEGPWERKISSIDFILKKSDAEDFRESDMQVRGIIKYLEPTKSHADMIQIHIAKLLDKDSLDQKKFLNWIQQTNPAWRRLIKQRLRRIKIINTVKRFYSPVAGWLR